MSLRAGSRGYSYYDDGTGAGGIYVNDDSPYRWETALKLWVLWVGGLGHLCWVVKSTWRPKTNQGADKGKMFNTIFWNQSSMDKDLWRCCTEDGYGYNNEKNSKTIVHHTSWPSRNVKSWIQIFEGAAQKTVTATEPEEVRTTTTDTRGSLLSWCASK